MVKNKYIIAFDFGTRNIGVAVGQCITYTARPLQSIKINKNKLYWENIKKYIYEWDSGIIVVGLPLDMNGNDQKITTKTRNFADEIRSKFNIQVILHDERLTTIEAKNWLFSYIGYRALQKNNIDSYSAVIILESWLTCMHF